MRASPRFGVARLAVVLVLALALGVTLWCRRPNSTPGDPGDVRSSRRGDRVESSNNHRVVGGRHPRAPAEEPSEAERGVAGRIVDLASGPLGEGRVDLVCSDGRRLATSSLSEEGNFSGPACPGTTCVRLIHPGVEQPGPWLLEPGEVVELEVEPAPTVHGVVVGPRGAPVAGAQLVLFAGERARSTSTDVDGAFAASFPAPRPCDPCDDSTGGSAGSDPSCRGALAPDKGEPKGETRGPVRVLVTAPHHAPLEVELRPDADAVHELQLSQARAPLTGALLDREGEPFDARAKILATSQLREGERHAAQVGDDGRFELTGLGDGGYELRAIRDGLELARVVQVTAGESVELRAESSRSGAKLCVQIVDPRGEPVVGARVLGGPFSGQRTDAQGRAEARRVLAGDYELRVQVGSCAPRRHRVEVIGGESEVERRLAAPVCDQPP